MEPGTVLLEDTWEASDVVEECGRRGVPCRELTVEALEAVEAAAFVRCTYMCSTELVQAKLREAGMVGKVPSTYPDQLRSLFHRAIQTRQLMSIQPSELPLFVKPTGNDKAFDGRVVRDAEALRSVVDECAGGGGGCASADSAGGKEVYTAEVVTFACEHRLFIGQGRLYGTGKIRNDGTDAGGSLSPPSATVDRVLSLCGDSFWAVDVGFIVKEDEPAAAAAGVGPDGAPGTWALVEVNPPFSLDDHGLPIEPYVQYCVDACAWIRGGGAETGPGAPGEAQPGQ